MTIYVHFTTDRPTVKLYNVSQIIETAPGLFTVVNPFSDTPSHVPGRQADRGRAGGAGATRPTRPTTARSRPAAGAAQLRRHGPA